MGNFVEVGGVEDGQARTYARHEEGAQQKEMEQRERAGRAPRVQILSAMETWNLYLIAPKPGVIS